MIAGLALSRCAVGVDSGGFDDDEGAASGGYIGGGPLGGGGNGIGDSGGTVVGIGVDGDGKIVFWLVFGGLIGLGFGCGVVDGESLMAPTCLH